MTPDEVRCARCQTWNPVHNLRHGYCLDCVSSVYLLAGNWCVQHGPFPLQVVKVGEIGDTGMVLEAPKPRDEQQCPWCDFRCHRHDVALAWGDYCVQCQVDALASWRWERWVEQTPQDAADLRHITRPRPWSDDGEAVA